MRALPPGLHLVGLSQSCPSLLVAAARHTAEYAQRRPACLSLLGGPLEPGHRPTGLQRLVAGYPRSLLMAGRTHPVPAPFAGLGRPVYSALLQLAALITADPRAYATLQAAVLAEQVQRVPPVFARAHEDLHRLLDVPAERFLDMVEWLGDRSGPTDPWPTAAGPLDPRRLAGVPLLTAEAGAEDLVGHGQTHAVRCRLGDRRGLAIDLPGAPHQALFTGPAFSRHPAPRPREVIVAGDV